MGKLLSKHAYSLIIGRALGGNFCMNTKQSALPLLSSIDGMTLEQLGKAEQTGQSLIYHPKE